MQHALIWLLSIEILGLIALPLAFNLFRRLPDRGLILSKILALLLLSYILWILGLTHVIPNSFYTIVAILAVMALISALIVRRKWREILSFLHKERVPLLTSELVFLGLYVLWLSVVSSAPAINHTEKPMDFAFLNSILRSAHFPPEDPWLAGHSISYYYFGHFMMASLTKLTAIPSNISYNLSIALIPALMGAGAFSLVYNLIRLSGARIRSAILFALAAPIFIAIIGNLEGVLELVHARGWGSDGFWQWVSIKGLDSAQSGDPSIFPRDYLWWWHATRVIDTVADGASLDYTITEFPFFSFLLGDLHPHVSALPFIVLVLALSLNLFISDEKLGPSWIRRYPWEVLAITLCLGSLAFINIWDFPTFIVLFVTLVLVKGYGDWGGQFKQALLPSLYLLVPVLVVAVLLYIPFYSDLSSQASGVLPVGDVSTRPLFFFLIWGLFLLLSGTFLFRQLWATPAVTGRNPGIIATVLVITLMPFLLWAGIELLALWIGWYSLVDRLDGSAIGSVSTVGTRFGMLLPGMIIVGVSLNAALLRSRHGGEKATSFVLLPLALAFYLLIGAELFRLVDLFGNRMNTVFKVYYQAWLLLAIVSAYGLYYVCSRPMPSFASPIEVTSTWVRASVSILGKTLRYGWVGVVAILFLASMYYSIGAALDRAKGNDGNTLDGLAFLERDSKGEYEAIRWLRDDAPWGRIVEAVGDDYSAHGRISASTGLPTVLGWKFHEQQWRGSTGPFLGREEQVEQIYTSVDPEQVMALLDTYDIRYVYVGPRERAKYGGGRFDKFSSFLQPIFQEEDVVIYERLQDEKRGVLEEDDGGTE